jgi:TPR repeat protein
VSCTIWARGVELDYGKTRERFEKATDLKSSLAPRFLGGLYKAGHGVVQDYGKAIELYRKGADAGNER